MSRIMKCFFGIRPNFYLSYLATILAIIIVKEFLKLVMPFSKYPIIYEQMDMTIFVETLLEFPDVQLVKYLAR